MSGCGAIPTPCSHNTFGKVSLKENNYTPCQYSTAGLTVSSPFEHCFVPVPNLEKPALLSQDVLITETYSEIQTCE